MLIIPLQKILFEAYNIENSKFYRYLFEKLKDSYFLKMHFLEHVILYVLLY